VNVIDAAHQTVKAYPGGAESLGPRVGIGPAVLRSKVNPNTETHHLSLAEADRIMGATGDHRILHALAAEHGYVLQAMDAEQGGAASLLQAVLQANAAEGCFDRRLDEALADSRVTPRELSELSDLAISQQAATARLVAKLAAVAASARVA
jgi:hypothetical protein